MERRILRQLRRAARTLGPSTTETPLEVKLRALELIMRLVANRTRFGLFVILGWRAKWRDYLDISDEAQDLFAERHIDIMQARTKRSGRDVGATVHFDGAILIDRRGV